MKKINNLRFLPRISEAEKRRRNPTYRNARKAYTKNLLFFFPVWIILLIIFVSVITNIENRILAGIVGLFLAASPIMGLGIACNLSLRLWVCPPLWKGTSCAAYSVCFSSCVHRSVSRLRIFSGRNNPLQCVIYTDFL